MLRRMMASALVPAAMSLPASGVRLYVSPAGNDAWSGTLTEPNDARTDGPLATLPVAVAAVRRLRVDVGAATRSVICLREGQYFLRETLALSAADRNLSLTAYPGESPEVIGGRLISGLRTDAAGRMSVLLPEVKDGAWSFKSLFVDGRRMVRARYPNVDAADPYRKGFVYAARDASAFGVVVGNIHNPGDWMEYALTVRATGDYSVWLYYGALNKPHGNDSMDGRSVVMIDGGEAVPLLNLPDTGGWGTFCWARCATLTLAAGEHVLRWENVKGGGLNLEAFAFANDPDWQPAGTRLPSPADGRHTVLVQAESFVRCNGKQLSVGGSGTGEKDRFYYRPGGFRPEWAEAPGAEVHIFQTGNCRAFMEIAHIASVDPSERLVVLGGPELNSVLHAGDRYFVENVESECDAPGEWYLNRQTGVLTLVPAAGHTEQSEVMAPTVGRVIEALGADGAPVEGLELLGLTFRGGDWNSQDGVIGYGMGTNGVIYLQNAQGCRIEGCTFRNIGKDAVCVRGGSGNYIRGNDISDSAEGGINIYGSMDNEIAGNHIHHCGAVYKHNGGITLQGGAGGNRVAGNVIHDMTRYGITMKNAGHVNIIECNRVLNTNLETYDTGGIEVTQHDRNERSGSIIRYNIVADTIGYSSTDGKSCFLSWGIYLDSFAGGYEVTRNIVYRTWNGGIMFQGGKDNRVHNNIFVDGKSGQGHISNHAGNQTGCTFERNIVCFSDPQAILFACGRLGPEVIHIDHNLYWCPGVTELKIGWRKTSFTDWQKQDRDMNSVIADPRFVDPSADDYALRPDSPAFALGFEPIDTSMVAKPCGCAIAPMGPVFFPATP